MIVKLESDAKAESYCMRRKICRSTTIIKLVQCTGVVVRRRRRRRRLTLAYLCSTGALRGCMGWAALFLALLPPRSEFLIPSRASKLPAAAYTGTPKLFLKSNSRKHDDDDDDNRFGFFLHFF